MASKALYLLCTISLLLAISGSITTARTVPADVAVPTLLDIVDEELKVIRSYIGSPKGPSPVGPARDSNGPVIPARDSNGPVVPARDSNGPVIPARDSNGPVIPARDSNGPVVPARDSNGPVIPARDSNGPVLPKPPAANQLLLEE